MAYIRLEVPDSRDSCNGCARDNDRECPFQALADVASHTAWRVASRPFDACLSARDPAPLPPEVAEERAACHECVALADMRAERDSARVAEADWLDRCHCLTREAMEKRAAVLRDIAAEPEYPVGDPEECLAAMKRAVALLDADAFLVSLRVVVQQTKAGIRKRIADRWAKADALLGGSHE